jgi:hypothetical protein
MFHSDAYKAYIHSRMRRRTADFLQGKSSPQNRMWNASADPRKCYGELVQKTKKRRERPQVDGHSRYKGAERSVYGKRGPKLKKFMIMINPCAQ